MNMNKPAKQKIWLPLNPVFVCMVIVIGIIVFIGNRYSLKILPKRERDTTSYTVGVTSAPGTTDTTTGLYFHPNYQVNVLPTSPVSVKYVVEHRSALNQKTITVRGIIISSQLFPPSCTGENCPLGLPQPSIILADTQDDTRDRNYDLRILFDENEVQQNGSDMYPVGNTIEIKGMVLGEKTGAVMRKI